MNINPDTTAHPGRHIALVVLLAAAVMNLIDGTILNVALPVIQRDLSASPTELKWVSVSYLLAFATSLLPFGRFGDVFGRRRVFILGVAGFTLTSTACGLAVNIETLIAARIAQGISGAAMMPQILALIRVVFPPEEQGAAFAKFTLASTLSAVSGPLIGGLLIQADLLGLGWRSIFLVNLPLGVAIIASLRLIPDMRRDKGLKVDKLGTIVFGAGIALLVLPLIEGRSLGWPWWIFLLMLAGFVSLVAFVMLQLARERAGAPQLLPAQLIRNREFMRGLLEVICLFFVPNGLMLVLGIYLQSGLALSALQAGLIISPFPAGVMIASIMTRKAQPKSQRTRINSGVAILLAALISLRIVVGIVHEPADAWYIGLPVLAAGLGMGFAVVALYPKVLATVSRNDAGAGSGAVQAAQHVGAVLGIAGIEEVFFATLAHGPAATGGQWSIAIANAATAGAVILGALLVLLLWNARRRRREARSAPDAA